MARRLPVDLEDWSSLRLKDRIAPGVRVLFVGINPGVRSAQTGHHFAGHSNRFWKLLYESGLVPEPITWQDDTRLPEFGFGITNIIARPSPGIDVLKPAEYVEGWKILEKKIRKFRPEVLAIVGVTSYRAILPLIVTTEDVATLAPSLQRRRKRKHRPTTVSVLGEQPHVVHGARVFVLPNPSGRNANFTYQEMLDAFRSLRAALPGAASPARR